jgi:uncharacterized SAM-dependent methyltransferase/ubiquinone/menaquinone biosynthesis C-methylase UbiE
MKRPTPNLDVDRQLEGAVRSGQNLERLEEIWKRAYAARTRDDLLGLYADWAETYDADHESVGFFGHVTASKLLARHTPHPEGAAVLDAGAGTGAAGSELAQLGFRNLTAVDLSQEMLDVAGQKGIYRRLIRADLGLPLDDFQASSFDAAILVGVFSYGQAPAHALEEIIRVVKPGGVIVFTMRTDFFESDAMSVRSKIEELQRHQVWELLEITPPQQYLPGKDPHALFRVWCYRVRKPKTAHPDSEFTEAVCQALSSPEPVKRLDHRHIWDSRASRLYNRYIETPQYYLNDCEEEILARHAEEIVGEESMVVELGCGSARKVKHLLEAATENGTSADKSAELTYVPIDLSPAALHDTRVEVENTFNGQVTVEPRHASFDQALPTVREHDNKLLVFFGSSIGNLESLDETVSFLHMVRQCMKPGDRFVVGMDLDKDEKVLREAYQAGHPNLIFFLNMVRRINDELGGNFDLKAFYQESSYDEEVPYQEVKNRCVNFKLITRKPQKVRLARVGMEAKLQPGEAIQVGISRKFRKEDIARLASLAGFQLSRQWTDDRHYFSLNELVLDTGQPSRKHQRRTNPQTGAPH